MGTISELEDRTLEISQSEQQRKKTEKKKKPQGQVRLQQKIQQLGHWSHKRKAESGCG